MQRLDQRVGEVRPKSQKRRDDVQHCVENRGISVKGDSEGNDEFFPCQGGFELTQAASKSLQAGPPFAEPQSPNLPRE
jgi:hypothetical protein